MNARSAERLQSGVEILPRLTKLGLVGISQREDGIAGALQFRSGIQGQNIPESLRIVWHFPVAIGAGDDQKVCLAGGVQRGVFGHVDDPRLDGSFFGGCGDLPGKPGCGSRAGAVECS